MPHMPVSILWSVYARYQSMHGIKVQPPAASLRHVAGFAYSVQKDVYADFQFCNDVAELQELQGLQGSAWPGPNQSNLSSPSTSFD